MQNLVHDLLAVRKISSSEAVHIGITDFELPGEDFSFGYVYSIVDVDISNAVAVNINNEYRKADIKNNDE